MNKGWISIHRKILKNPILKMNRSYSKFEAWIYLLLRATYSDQKVVLGADIYKLKSGEILTSQKKLCKQFKWGNSRLRTFLQLLEKDGMIKVKTNSKLTMITILNYNKLQKNQIATKSQSNYNQIHSNKDINKDNKESLQVRFKDFLKKCEKLNVSIIKVPTNFPVWTSEYSRWDRTDNADRLLSTIKDRINILISNNNVELETEGEDGLDVDVDVEFTSKIPYISYKKDSNESD